MKVMHKVMYLVHVDNWVYLETHRFCGKAMHKAMHVGMQIGDWIFFESVSLFQRWNLLWVPMIGFGFMMMPTRGLLFWETNGDW